VCAAEDVDMIPIHAHPFYLDLVSLLDASRRLLNDPDDLLVKEGFPVLHREDNVVMNLPGTTVPFVDCAFMVHLTSITKQGAPVASYRELSS